MISELNIGSNIIVNTSGVLTVQGSDQIYLEWGDRSGQLLLTMDVYDAQGTHVARLRRNAWAFNDKGRFAITTHPTSLTLTDRESGQWSWRRVWLGLARSRFHPARSTPTRATYWKSRRSTGASAV